MNGLNDDLKARILRLIDSHDMRDYCMHTSENWTAYQYAELIVSALKSIEQKIELLQSLCKLPMDEKQNNYLNECCQAAQTAMKCLYKNQQEKSILLVRSMDTEFPDVSCMGTEPVLSYDDFLLYIREEFTEDGAGEPEEVSERSDFYFILDLYEKSESDSWQHSYRYICAPNGEVQYFEKITAPNNDAKCFEKAPELNGKALIQPEINKLQILKKQECTKMFDGRNGLNYWRTPFQAGDILYVDCRPYFMPTYCVIHYINPEMPSDCCGLRCLYLTHCGYIGEAAVKHGGFLPTGLDDVFAGDRQFISPLYRAEIFRGELPEKYAVLNIVSEKLKASPELGLKIDKYFFGDQNNGQDERRYITFTYQIGIANSSDEGIKQETNVCDRRRNVPAVTEDRLLKILG